MTDAATVDRALARDIVTYCLRNPHAAGDLEDFVRWRLMEQRVHLQLTETKKALEWLVSTGLLSQSQAGAAAIFTLNADRRVDAERFVAGDGDQQSPKEGV